MIYIEVFIYLQLLDFITTLIGMRLGLGEASPFIRWLMHVGPAAGLAVSKLVAFDSAARASGSSGGICCGGSITGTPAWWSGT